MITTEGAKATRLGTLLPADTANHDLFTATLVTELTRLHVCNVSGGAATFRVWHLPAGVSVANAYALIYDLSVAAATAYILESSAVGTGAVMEPGDSILIRSSVSSALAFNLYGLTPEMSPRAG